VAADRIFGILDTTEMIPNKGTLKKDTFEGAIEFKNVFFSYDGEHDVIKGLSLKVNPGETMAIVGSTGSGKSTIINILNRFYDIREGHVCIDGVDINKYELYAFREHIAMVLQDVFLFSGTVIENITLRNTGISREQVIEASKTIGAHPFIESLPGAYDFKVAERGANLSMGQRQLISFVRALVFDPDILILDEATSSIDSETEAIIQSAIETLIKKRTSIIIAHRLSTIRNADNILVLDHGERMEFGPHDELLKTENGLYQKLYQIQFEHSGAGVQI
ncbi:MAG: ABC transporter ATP-binding protein, partial [Bacteroidetes bacterium]